MSSILGFTLLFLSLLLCSYSILASFYANINGYKNLEKSSVNALFASCITIFISSFLLIFELINSNFELEYVSKYSSSFTPLIYKISAFWAGMEGSMLFWLFILSIYIFALILSNKEDDYLPWVWPVLGIIQLFFIVLTTFFENPFRPALFVDEIGGGAGLNPLLQHPAMLIHPPMLYLGYIGFSVPFAYAVSAMIQKKTTSEWLLITKRWTLFSWLLLSVAIVLGGRWAYLELGWGGYWAWDPVENASFMPWLTGTAYLHSVLIEEKKNMLKFWNVLLIMLTFLLTIFGTYLTRSGIVSSVHAFAATDLGIWFFYFVIFILSSCVIILTIRKGQLKPSNRIKNIFSKESGFLFNNLIFISLLIVVLWGTMFPIINEAFSGDKITVGAAYFNKIVVPIGLCLLLLMGVAPLLAWKKTSIKQLLKNLKSPLIISLIITFIFGFYLDNFISYTTISIFIIFLTLIIILREFLKGVRIISKKENLSFLKALYSLLNRNRPRYGGYIVHVGIIVMLIGFTGHAFNREVDLSFSMDNSTQSIEEYRFIYKGHWIESIDTHPIERKNHVALVTELDIFEDNDFVGTLLPEKRIYIHQNNQQHAEVMLISSLLRDIYIILGSLDESGQATMKIRINPMVNFVWIGISILFLGGLLCLDFDSSVLRMVKRND